MVDILDQALEAVVSRIGDDTFVDVKSVLLIVGDPDANLLHAREAGQFLEPNEPLFPGDRIACRVLDTYWYITIRDTGVDTEELDQDILAVAQLAWIDDGRAPLIDDPLRYLDPPLPDNDADSDAADRATSDLGAIPTDSPLLRSLADLSADELEADELEQLGYEILFFQHDLIQESLDLAEQENEMVVDALTMAVDQVQDMRITWLEKPPRTPWSEILIVAVLMITIELGVAALAAHLIFRAIRISARIKVQGQLLQSQKGINQKLSLSANLKNIHEQQIRRVTIRENAVQLRAFQMSRKQKLHQWQATRRKKLTSQRGLEKSQSIAKQIEKQQADLRTEIGKASKEFERLSGDLKLTDSMRKLGSNEHFDSLVSPYLRNLSPQISSITGKYTKEVPSRGLNKAGEKDSGLRGQQEPKPEALPTGADEKDSPEGMDGDTPSTVIRSQVLRWRRTQLLEIARIRRMATSIYNHALVRPDTLNLAMRGLRDTMAGVVWPEESRIDYARAIRELSKKFEFLIWAQLLPNIHLTDRNPQDQFLKGDKYQGEIFDFLVDGVNREVAEYLIKRFSKDNEYSERAIIRIVGEMNKHNALLEEKSREIMKQYSTSKQDLKLNDTIAPGTLKSRYRKDANDATSGGGDNAAPNNDGP